MLSGAPAETCSAARLIVPLWSAAASPCWAAENGAPRVHPVAAHAPCSSPVAAHALLLLPCTAQFLLLELADGNYAMMLPLISQNTFRGTLRPPRQAPAAADAACCDCGTLGCMPSKAGRRSTWRAVYKGQLHTSRNLQRLSAAQLLGNKCCGCSSGCWAAYCGATPAPHAPAA